MSETAPDKYKATWVSHSSISDFLTCPKLYYYRAIYRNPTTGHKITIMSPPLALGGVVHDVVESLSILPVEERLAVSPLKKYDTAWKNISGEKGGFKDQDEEGKYYNRGKEMIQRVIDNPGPINKKAVKIKEELPHYWLSKEDGIILCGKIDWLEYIPKKDAVHIIDFKTGRGEESADSLQLPIYLLLVKNTQRRQVAKASYWYLDRDVKPKKQTLPDEDESFQKVYTVAKRMKLARSLERFKCKSDGCRWCGPYERAISGHGKKVGESVYKQDIYVLH